MVHPVAVSVNVTVVSLKKSESPTMDRQCLSLEMSKFSAVVAAAAAGGGEEETMPEAEARAKMVATAVVTTAVIAVPVRDSLTAVTTVSF
jgi:hypothetical protein